VRITKNAVQRTCAVCGRTLLLGERTTRYAPDGANEYVDVCSLCHEIATEHGWVKEGSPTTPTVPLQRRRRRTLASLFERPAPAAPVASEPILRRLSEPELAVVEAADLFNGSQYRRTVGGIAKSLGEPKVSIVPLGGVNRELVLTIAWEISWYQYRVTLDSAQPVRLTDRGLEIDELEGSATDWNARVEPDGRVVPAIARL
jgi:hypothetical protein